MLITLIVAWIIFIILLKVIKTTVSNALIAAAILTLLYTGFGITPQDVWNYITQVTQNPLHLPISK